MRRNYTVDLTLINTNCSEIIVYFLVLFYFQTKNKIKSLSYTTVPPIVGQVELQLE